MRRFSSHSATVMVLAFSLLLPGFVQADPLVVAWFKSFGVGNSGANAVAVDSSNNVIVTGTADSRGYGTIKYSRAGVILWTNYWNDPSNRPAVALHIAVDGSDNVIVSGNSTTGTHPDANDYATIKYSKEGVPLWTNRFDGNEGAGYHYNYVKDLALDSSNNVVVTGYSTPDGTHYAYATVKYSSAGVPLWTNLFNDPAINGLPDCGVTLDRSNNVIVKGYAGSGYATIKYTAAGLPVWTNYYTGPTNAGARPCALTTDENGNVIVTGYDGASHPDYATVKYSAAGEALWTNRYNGPANGTDIACAVAADQDGSVFVTGYADGGMSGNDYVTLKYSSDGTPLWTNRCSRTPVSSDDRPCALAIDSLGNAIVTGFSGASAYLTVKYSTAGVLLWTNYWSGGMATSLAVDSHDDVIVTGKSAANPSRFLTIKYGSPCPPILTALPLTNGMFQMRVDELLLDCTGVIETSTDLATWIPVFTNTKPVNTLVYTDLDTANCCGRFYRAFQHP